MERRRTQSIWILVPLLGALAMPSAADDASRVRALTLKNGLQILLLPDPQATAVDVAVWYRAGTRTEPAGKTGLSSMFGRLMFQGSSSRPAPDGANAVANDPMRLLQAEGATVNSAIQPDYSSFYETLPCESLDLALKVEAERMNVLAITPANFEAERRIALEERRRRVQGNPIGAGLQRLYATAFAGHPYGRPSAGAGDDLERLTLADAVAYHRERYGPQDAVLTIVGCVDPEPTIAAARRYFEPLAKRPDPPLPAASMATLSSERRVVETAPIPGPLLLMGWRAAGAGDPDRPALELLSHIVSSGPSSRLQQMRNARKNVFLLVNGDVDVSKEASLMFCMTAVRSLADSAVAESALVAEIQKLATQPVTTDELDRVKHQAEAATLFGLQTVRGRAQELGAAQLLEGDYRASEKRLDRVRRLTAADLQRVAAKVFRPENRSVVWLMPSGAPGAGGRP